MVWLRPILLVCAVVFIGALIWMERRRPSRVQSQSDERSDPVIHFADESAVTSARTAMGAAATPRGPDPGRALPVIDWSVPLSASTSEPEWIYTRETSGAAGVAGAAETDADDTPGRYEFTSPPAPSVISASLAPASIAGAAAPPPAHLQVDWPPEQERQIAALRIVAARQNRIAGRALRQGLAAAGFRHGEFGIYHLGDAEGRVILSAASLVRPGVLDPDSMDFQSFSGVNLFAVLPGPLDNALTLERLTSVAAELAQRVEGRVQDERGAPFDSVHTGPWRERLLAGLVAQARETGRHTGPAD